MSPKDIAPASPHAARRTAFAVLAAAAALSVSACGEAPTGTLHTRAGYTETSDEVPVSVCPAEGESRFTGDEGLLVGAHFALRVECVASFDRIPDDFQLEYLLGENAQLYSPEPGYEFTLVQFAPDPGAAAPFTVNDGEELSATLKVGDRQWDFDGEVPAPGAVYLTVAEKDAPISLEVVDAERTQTIDMRARTRTGLIEALYHGSTSQVTTDLIEHSVDGYTESGSYSYSFEDLGYATEFTLTREVFDPDAGWVAENDRARLTVSFGWVHSNNGLEWSIDPEKALKVSGPEGAMTAASVDHVDEDWEYGVWRTFTLQYDIPADALAFDLTFHPEGPVDWPAEGVSIPISGDKSHDVSASFE
jgi:hypothetical protein